MVIFGILFMLFGIGMLVVIARQPVRPSPRQKRAAGVGFIAHDAASGGIDPLHYSSGMPSSSHDLPSAIETSSSWDGGSSFSGSSFDSGSSSFDSGASGGFDSGGSASSGGDGCG